MIQFLGLVSIGLMTTTLLLLLFSTTPWVLVTLAFAGAVPCLVDTLTLAQNGPENARDHHAEEHLHR